MPLKTLWRSYSAVVWYGALASIDGLIARTDRARLPPPTRLAHAYAALGACRDPQHYLVTLRNRYSTFRNLTCPGNRWAILVAVPPP